jgi:hypothetical protein
VHDEGDDRTQPLGPDDPQRPPDPAGQPPQGYNPPPGRGYPEPQAGWEEEPPSKPSSLPLILSALAALLALGAIVVAVTTLGGDDEPAEEEPAGPIQTADIADGSITSEKLADGAVIEVKLADGAVVSAKLADESVATPKLAGGSVTNNRIASGAVGTQRLGDDAVVGPKVQDDSLTGDDIDEETLAKVPAAVEADTAAVAEVAQSIEDLDFGDLTPSIEIAQAQSDSSADDAKSVSAACPDGTQLVGGGGGIGGDATGVTLVRSSADGNGWTVVAQELVPSEAAWSVDAVAFCASLGG